MALKTLILHSLSKKNNLSSHIKNELVNTTNNVQIRNTRLYKGTDQRLTKNIFRFINEATNQSFRKHNKKKITN